MPENQTQTNLQKNFSVLITGGSGLVERYLTSPLRAVLGERSDVILKGSRVSSEKLITPDTCFFSISWKMRPLM